MSAVNRCEYHLNASSFTWDTTGYTPDCLCWKANIFVVERLFYSTTYVNKRRHKVLFSAECYFVLCLVTLPVMLVRYNPILTAAKSGYRRLNHFFQQVFLAKRWPRHPTELKRADESFSTMGWTGFHSYVYSQLGIGEQRVCLHWINDHV